MKICLLGAELFQTDGRTDMTKLIVAFRNFANLPNNVLYVISDFGLKVTENCVLLGYYAASGGKHFDHTSEQKSNISSIIKTGHIM
jgi:hypothetical protein